MKHRRLGRTGLKVSEICLGTMTFAGQCDEATALRILDAAADRGVTFIDTADVYPIPPDPETAGRTEEVIGRWLAAIGPARSSSCWRPSAGCGSATAPNDQGLSRRHILAACEASLRRLQTDYIDLYQAHCPTPRPRSTRPSAPSTTSSGQGRSATSVAPIMPPGSSRWPWASASGQDWARYDCVQPRYNLLYREIETELLPLCRDQGVGVIVYNPLAGGLLSGKHAADAAPDGRDAVHPGRLGRALSRPLLARRAVRGGRRPSATTSRAGT